ncbi:hypothetical protein LMG27198_08030 [Methylocystis echinoides]|jgi:hypothetical protein|uniref:Uncharacterized protein n=1 Tax=Methylocystis echinoides TaxID=29468 RepID=A0A9W6GRR3_9HYPH|nr:hypothetical protein LMG27198_08030 [Methylocystis echinoides]
MTEEGKEPAPAAKASESGGQAHPSGARKNKAALSAALRANLARRKARERALRGNAQKTDSEG